jgi:GLPGLI family protein
MSLLNETKKELGNKIPDKLLTKAIKQYLDAQQNLKNFNYVLKFNNKESIYKVEAGLINEMDAKTKSILRQTGGIHYQNSTTKTILRQNINWGELYLIKDPMPKDWKITTESKTIGKYKVFKATRIDPENKREMVAWFTPEIAVPFGPKNYGGLPGLILEIKFHFGYGLKAERIKLYNNQIKIKKPTKGKLVTKEQHKELMKEVRKKIRKYY